MRPRKQDRHLPACLYQKHGSYWLVKQGKWHNLGRDYAEALQEYAKRQQVTPVKKGGMPELIDRVMDVHLKHLSGGSKIRYRYAGERLKNLLAEFEPQQVKPRHIAAIKINMAATPNQCNRLLSVLNIVFSYALEWELIESNPCAGIRKHKENKRTRYISHDEFNALLAHLSEPMQRLFTLTYLTGQSIGDVLRLHQDNISEAGIAFIQQKTKAKLLIRMTADIEQVLSAIQPSKQGWLFYTGQGSVPLHYETAHAAFAEACQAAGVTDATIHDLRAKSLTDANEQGKDAQKLGGHASASMTKRYLRGRKPTEASAPNLPQKSPEY